MFEFGLFLIGSRLGPHEHVQLADVNIDQTRRPGIRGGRRICHSSQSYRQGSSECTTANKMHYVRQGSASDWNQ
eukprot:6292947-Amphidinium_carterae.1